jgi:hypothetical protein
MRRTTFLGVMILAIVTSTTRAEDPVYFPDAKLKAAVEQQLGVSNPTPSDMARLTLFQSWNGGITDLTGLEHATNLTVLYLEMNQVSNLSPIAGLTKLTDLYVGYNRITDISPLSGLTNLRKLTFYDNADISDISSLSGLTQLTSLHFGSNQVSDISALSGLTNLTSLSFSVNPVSDISALVPFPVGEFRDRRRLQRGSPQVHLLGRGSVDSPQGSCSEIALWRTRYEFCESTDARGL